MGLKAYGEGAHSETEKRKGPFVLSGMTPGKEVQFRPQLT